MDMNAVFDTAFPQSRSSVRIGSLSLETAREIAQDYIATEFPDARCAFLFGSLLSGESGPYSDVDVIVVRPAVHFAETKRMMVEGVPLEIHVFDESTISFGLEYARSSGRVNAVFSIQSAMVVLDVDGAAGKIRSLVDDCIASGPLALPPALAKSSCYDITTLILDLAKAQTAGERMSIGASLFPMLMTAYFRINGKWAKGKKWGLRDAGGFGNELTEAMQNVLISGNIAPLISLTENLLEPWGGFIWAGSSTRLWPSRTTMQNWPVQLPNAT